MTLTKNIGTEWVKIAPGGSIAIMQNRSSVPYEIFIGKEAPSQTTEGFLIYEQTKEIFTNLPIYAKSKQLIKISILYTIPNVSELNNAIHTGSAYSLTGYGTLAANGSISYLAITGEKEVHFDEFIAELSAGNVVIELFEEPDISNIGTSIQASALNRANIISPQSLLYVNPTFDDQTGETLHDSKAIETGIGTNSNPGFAAIAYGRVLRPKTNYIVRLTNLDTNAAVEYSVVYIFHESGVDL